MLMEDRVAVVTGGASGNGQAIAERLALEGAHVLIADVNEAGMDQVVAGIRDAGGTAIGLRCDVTDEADVEALMAAAGVSLALHTALIVGLHPRQFAAQAQAQSAALVARLMPVASERLQVYLEVVPLRSGRQPLPPDPPGRCRHRP